MTDKGATVDFGYLEGFAAGDQRVVDEILDLFVQEAAGWSAGLTAVNPDWRAVVHTIKGSGRGIGARPLGDVCEACELDGEGGLPAVRLALDDAVSAIRAYRAR